MSKLRTTPQDGDVVVCREHRDGTIAYVLHTAPGPDESVFHSCEGAVAQAVTIAKRNGTRAWYTTDEGCEFVPLGTLFSIASREDSPSRPAITECERRLHELTARLRSEYLEMPGLRLTVRQAQRLCGVEHTVCQMMFDALVEQRFLRINRDGSYVRLTEGRHQRQAKASLEPSRLLHVEKIS